MGREKEDEERRKEKEDQKRRKEVRNECSMLCLARQTGQ